MGREEFRLMNVFMLFGFYLLGVWVFLALIWPKEGEE